VSAVASILEVPEPAASPAASFTRLGRLAAAATLVIGATCQVIVFAVEPQHTHTVDRLEWIAAHPDRANVAKLFDVLAMPFLLGGVLVYVLLSRRRSPRLAYAGGILLGCGMVGLSTVQGFETLAFSLAQDGRFDLAALADRVDNTASAPAIAMLLLFLPGAFLGTLTVSAALWRSRAVPRGAVLLLPVFIVVDAFLQQGLPGHVIGLVGRRGSRSRCCARGRPSAGRPRPAHDLVDVPGGRAEVRRS
jgi:amino acid transporter